MAEFGDHRPIEASIPLGPDGLIRVPSEVIEDTSLRIGNMPPHEVFYASGNSVVHDRTTRALMIDTRDYLLGMPTNERQVLENPAVMRVMRSMAGKAIDGWLIDYRRIRFPRYRDAKLELGTDTDTFRNLQEDYGTTLPLGVVFDRAGTVEYHGPEELRDDMEGLMARVDDYLAAQWPYLPKFAYSIPDTDADIKRPPKPVPAIEARGSSTSTEIEVYRRPPRSPTPSGDIVGDFRQALGNIWGKYNFQPPSATEPEQS